MSFDHTKSALRRVTTGSRSSAPDALVTEVQQQITAAAHSTQVKALNWRKKEYVIEDRNGMRIRAMRLTGPGLKERPYLVTVTRRGERWDPRLDSPSYDNEDARDEIHSFGGAKAKAVFRQMAALHEVQERNTEQATRLDAYIIGLEFGGASHPAREEAVDAARTALGQLSDRTIDTSHLAARTSKGIVVHTIADALSRAEHNPDVRYTSDEHPDLTGSTAVVSDADGNRILLEKRSKTIGFTYSLICESGGVSSSIEISSTEAARLGGLCRRIRSAQQQATDLQQIETARNAISGFGK